MRLFRFAVILACVISLTAAKPAMASSPLIDNNMEVFDPSKMDPKSTNADRETYRNYVNAHNELVLGMQLTDEEHLNEALVHLKNAVELSNNFKVHNGLARIYLAKCLSKLGQNAKALQELDTAIKAYPALGLAYETKVEILESLGHHKKALEACDTWTRNSKYNREPLLRSAAILLKSGTSKEAADRAFSTYRYCARHNRNISEAADLLVAAGREVPKELPRSNEGNNFIWRTLKSMIAITEPPVSGTGDRSKGRPKGQIAVKSTISIVEPPVSGSGGRSKGKSKGQIEELYRALSEKKGDLILVLGFGQSGPSRPAREEIFISLSQDLCIINPEDVLRRFPTVRETSEKPDESFAFRLGDTKWIQFKQDLPNGKILYLFSPSDPPDLKMIHAIWTSTKEPVPVLK